MMTPAKLCGEEGPYEGKSLEFVANWLEKKVSVFIIELKTAGPLIYVYSFFGHRFENCHISLIFVSCYHGGRFGLG